MEKTVLVKDKFLLSIKEAASYFNIGEKKIRSLAHEHGGTISVQDGNRILIKRVSFEKFLSETSAV